jgi:hypothetical protein
VLGLIAVALPNSNVLGEQVLAICRRNADRTWFAFGAMIVLCGVLVVINDARDSVSPFIYFNF